MIIESAAISMASTHSRQEQTLREERLQIWGSNPPPPAKLDMQSLFLQDGYDSVNISEQAQQLSAAEKDQEYFQITSEDEAKIQTLLALIEAFTGKKIRMVIPRLAKNADSEQELKIKLHKLGNSQNHVNPGWGMEYHATHIHHEEEKMSFAAEGIVKTADGKQINLSLQLNMSRSFYERQDIHISAGNAAPIDPLVINFDAPAAELTTDKFSFDLDADGNADNISFLKPGSGFLALDQNQDGFINDGKELFGPQSGNGFTELAQYDADGNNWIDENDPIWDQLRIWTKDKEGNDVLFALGEKGIGAIYLGHISTSFALKDANNQEHGQLQSTGLFLRENGTAGTVQQIDLLG